jgi:hypothetical protein
MCGSRKRKRLEARRQKTLSAIREQRSLFEAMARRAQIGGFSPEGGPTDLRERFVEVERLAAEATVIDELDDLIDDAESTGQLRAYLCPLPEIVDEGTLAIDVMVEWGVPGGAIARLRDSLGKKLEDKDGAVARGALRAIFEEFDSWSNYIDEYNDDMKRFARVLTAVILVSSLVAIVILNYDFFLLLGLFLGGVAGGCVSVIRKMPTLDVSPSGELAAYERRILGRVSTGAIASLVGCALLAWGFLPVSIQNQTFGDMLNSCTADSSSCTVSKILILLGVSILFGFSERALPSFEATFSSPRGEQPTRVRARSRATRNNAAHAEAQSDG